MKLRLLLSLPALVPLLTLFFPASTLRAQYVQATTNYVQHFFRLSTQAVPGTVASILGTATIHRATSAVRADDSDRADLATVATWADRSVYSTFSDYSTNATYFSGTDAWMEFIGHTAVVHRIVAKNTNFVGVLKHLEYNGPYTPLHYSGTNQSGLPYWQTAGIASPTGVLTHDPSALTWTLTANTNRYYGIYERVFTNKSESAYALPLVVYAQPGGEAKGSASLSWGLTTEIPDPVVTVSTLDFTTAFTNTTAAVAAEAMLRASGDLAGRNYADAVSAAAKTQAVDEASAYADAVSAAAKTQAVVEASAYADTVYTAAQSAAQSYASTLMQTGTAARATSADYATVAGTATILLGESAWFTMSGTTGLLYRVETNTNVIRVVSHSQDYNGPSGPFYYYGQVDHEIFWDSDDHADYVVQLSSSWRLYGNSPQFVGYAAGAVMPALLDYLDVGTGTCTLDWGLATNAYAIATTADLDAALAAYSTIGHVHAIADVTGLQDALDTIPDEAEIESIAEAAASAALAALPQPGCTDLSTSTNVTVTGATVTYAATPSGAYTIGIATNAPRYAYAIEIAGTNAASFATGITLRGDWTPSGTNLVVLYPGTGTLYRAAGRAY
jgi:hypothetical protein